MPHSTKGMVVAMMKNFFDGKKALVVINPISGRRTTKSQLFDIADLFSTGGLETTVYTTRGKGDATEIVRRRGHDFDIVVCRGGDGTFHEMVNGVMQLGKKPLLGYIPAGSTNDLANTLCIPVNNNKEAIDIILNGQPLWNDMGLFNGETYYCYTASVGAFTELSYSTPQSMKNKIGHAAYFVPLAKSFLNLKPMHVKVKTAEGFEEEDDYIYCSVSNSVIMAGTIKFKRREVGLNDGRFELLLGKFPRNVNDWGVMVETAITHNFKHERVRMLHSSRVEFEFDEPMPWTLDGEYAGEHKHVVIENCHNAVQIFRR
jgi:YegS/Rv2252/BmrU family lipid kinase